MTRSLKIFIFLILNCVILGVNCTYEEEVHGVIYANPCEACKILATELEDRLSQTGKSHDVIETGYQVDDVKAKKRIEYRRSELRFIESMDGVCENVLQYNLHKERKDSTRFAKGMSQTFKTLHGLVDKGVKVDLGIPLELWDTPPAEVAKLKTQCETLQERYESDIEHWYFNEQEKGTPLIKYLCEDIALKGYDASCLYETVKEEDKKDEKSKEEL